jgi:hypothetical protein
MSKCVRREGFCYSTELSMGELQHFELNQSSTKEEVNKKRKWK